VSKERQSGADGIVDVYFFAAKLFVFRKASFKEPDVRA
jgi:hypothetical protein